MIKTIRNVAMSLALVAAAPTLQANLIKEDALSGIESIKNAFHAEYAPKAWKAQNDRVDIDWIFNYDKRRVLLDSDLTLPEYQQEIQRSIQDIKDYHVGINFTSTEISFLPFRVVMVDEFYFPRFFITSVYDYSLPIEVGDEVAAIGGERIDTVIEDLYYEMGFDNRRATDMRLLSEIYATVRPRSAGYDVPQGATEITVVKKSTGQYLNVPTQWWYRPDMEIGDTESSATEGETNAFVRNVNAELASHHQFFSKLKLGADTPEADAFQIGARKSYTPELGTIVLEAPEDAPFYWYIFEGTDGKYNGYIRLNSYSPSNPSGFYHYFGAVMNFFDMYTEKLVIDQNHNPGGYVFYLYALASIFSDGSMEVPMHQEKTASFSLDWLNSAISYLETLTNDEQAQQVLGSDWSGYPVDLKFARDYVDYLKAVREEKLAGKTLTRPLPFNGVRTLVANPTYRYTKPVVLLADAMCFSGGDFFPAIMQDSQRMTVLGQNTAGAGGYVVRANLENVPSSLKISSVALTGSLAWRASGQPIESLGVAPDVPYNLSARDVQYNFVDYKAAILQALKQAQ